MSGCDFFTYLKECWLGSQSPTREFRLYPDAEEDNPARPSASCHPPPWWSPPPWCCYSPSWGTTNQGIPVQSWCRERQSPIIMPVLATKPTYLGKHSHLVLGIFVEVWWQLTDHLGSGKIAIVVCRYLVRYLCRREERRSEGMHGLSLATKSQELCNPKTVRYQKIKLRIEHNLNMQKQFCALCNCKKDIGKPKPCT